jgi:Putative transposase, YhgA-like
MVTKPDDAPALRSRANAGPVFRRAVSDELRERFADALLEVESHGEPTLIHLLFEHKSNPERFTVVDLFDSVARIWKTWLRNHKSATTVPRVLPIVFHHGSVAWNQPSDIRQVLAGDADVARAFAPYDPIFPVVFHDLGGVDDPEAAIRNVDDPLARCVTFLLLVSRLRDYVDQLKRVGGNCQRE